MELTKAAQEFNSDHEKFQSIRQQKVSTFYRFQFVVLCLGTLATCLSFFKPHFEFIAFENSTVNIVIAIVERVSIFISTSLATCCALYFSSIFQSIPVEFNIFGQSLEQVMQKLEDETIDENQLDAFSEQFKVHAQQHQKLFE